MAISMVMADIAFHVPKKVAARDVAELRKKLQLSQEGFGRLVEVATRTVARWEAAEAEPEPFLVRRLRGIEKVVQRLEKAGDPQAIVQWLEKPASEFDGYRPVDLLGSDWATKQLLDRLDEWAEGQ
jgi:transcriptional regulator with XRE-family HTH domain